MKMEMDEKEFNIKIEIYNKTDDVRVIYTLHAFNENNNYFMKVEDKKWSKSDPNVDIEMNVCDHCKILTSLHQFIEDKIKTDFKSNIECNELIECKRVLGRQPRITRKELNEDVK